MLPNREWPLLLEESKISDSSVEKMVVARMFGYGSDITGALKRGWMIDWMGRKDSTRKRGVLDGISMRVPEGADAVAEAESCMCAGRDTQHGKKD